MRVVIQVLIKHRAFVRLSWTPLNAVHLIHACGLAVRLGGGDGFTHGQQDTRADNRLDSLTSGHAVWDHGFTARKPARQGSEIMEDIRCGRCGRKLTTTASRDRGYGPKCKAIRDREAAAILRDYSGDQITKALFAIESGAALDCGSGIYRIQSATRMDYYYTGSNCCPCYAGARRRVCWHTATVRLLELA